MIRVRYGYVDDIRKALLKIRESDAYKKFCSKFSYLTTKYEQEIPAEEILALESLKLWIMEKITMELIENILERRLAPHISKIQLKRDMQREPTYRENKLIYRKCAIKRVETFVRILQNHALKIIPQYAVSLEYEMKKLVEDFRLTRTLPRVQ